MSMMQDSIHDTICALATPPGIAGLAVIRISGPATFDVCSRLFSGAALQDVPPHTIHYGWWQADGQRVDSVTCSVFRTPHSYTGEDVVEIGCHGGHHVTRQIISSLVDAGVRLAEPGEFTRRAFLNGKLDLTQVEAVADIIHSESKAGAQTAARQLAGGFTRRLAELRQQLLDVAGLMELELDFSEEDVEFVDKRKLAGTLEDIRRYTADLADTAASAEILRSGFYCAVVGYPNAGKSSLFNALLNRDRAIVSDIPGTTRDYLEESIVVEGCTIHLYDTAGLRDTADSIELQGIVLTSSLIERSNLVLIVNDGSAGLGHSDGLLADIRHRFGHIPCLVIQNKADIFDQSLSGSRSADILCSARTGTGISELKAVLAGYVRKNSEHITDILVNSRQAGLLRQIVLHLSSALESLSVGRSNEFISVDIRTAIRLLGDISGETWNPDLLDTVFSRFCIGK